MSNKIARVWVVEKLEKGFWMPTAWVRFTRREARIDCEGRKILQPYEKFRVSEYTRYA